MILFIMHIYPESSSYKLFHDSISDIWFPGTWILNLYNINLEFMKCDLRLHIKTLLESHKEFKCDSCGESFTLRIAKLERSYQNNSWRSKRLQMWLLWKSFAGATSHGIHIKTYKDFKCEYCGKSFAQAGNLRV